MPRRRPAAAHFQLDADLKEKVSDIAAAQGLSLSATLRLILKAFFDRAGAEPRVSPLGKLTP